jgi:predicted RNA-binding protein YlqC (UPF0109 family)
LSKLQSLNLTQREASKTTDAYNCQLCERDRMWYICLTCSSECNRLCSACNAVHKDSVEFANHRTVLADSESIGIADAVTAVMKPPSQLSLQQFTISGSSFILDNLYDHLTDDRYLLDPERPAPPPGLNAPVFDTFNIHSGGNSSQLDLMSSQSHLTTQNIQKNTNRSPKPLSDPALSSNAPRVIVELEDFPSHLIGALIGLEGARIKRIRQESGCRINVLKTPGSIVNGNALIATIEYSGTPEAILRAKTLVAEVKVSKTQEMSSDPSRMTENESNSVPTVGLGLGLGLLKQQPPLLRRVSSSSIIDDEMDVELARMFAFLEGISPSARSSANGPILVTPTGQPDSFLNNLMQLREIPSAKEVMMLNLRMVSEEVGKLMGPKGGRIRNLQKVSGCKAFVYKSVDNLKTKDCCLLVKGPANKMVGALFLVSDILCRSLCRFPEDFNIEDFDGYSRFTNHAFHQHEDYDGAAPPYGSNHQQQELVISQQDIRSIRIEINHGDLGKLIGPRGDSISAIEMSHNCQIKLVKSVSGQDIDQTMSLFDVVGHPDNVASVLTNFQAVLGKRVKVSELSSIDSSAKDIQIQNVPYISKSAMALSLDSYSLISGGSPSKGQAAKVNQDESLIQKFVSMDSFDVLQRFDSSDSVDSTSELMFDSTVNVGDGLIGDNNRVYVPKGSPPTMVTAVIQCPIDAVGHLIGLRGSNLKRLCKISGCKIIIDEAVKGQVPNLIDVNIFIVFSSTCFKNLALSSC